MHKISKHCLDRFDRTIDTYIHTTCEVLGPIRFRTLYMQVNITYTGHEILWWSSCTDFSPHHCMNIYWQPYTMGTMYTCNIWSPAYDHILEVKGQGHVDSGGKNTLSCWMVCGSFRYYGRRFDRGVSSTVKVEIWYSQFENFHAHIARV